MSEKTIIQETEEVIFKFWKELLNSDSISPDDRLLEVGGNSLIATMLANRIELSWGFRPSMADLMTKSVAELSEDCGKLRK